MNPFVFWVYLVTFIALALYIAWLYRRAGGAR